MQKNSSKNVTKITLPSYAKINETLQVGEIQENGLHEISSRMRKISLHDDLALEDSDTFSITLSSESNVSVRNNLVEKAWRMINTICETDYTPKVTIHKRIPIGSGLGGGSSNYATFVHAFVAYYNITKLFQERFEKIIEESFKDGSDIPFFLQNSTCADIRGTGDILTPTVLPTTKKDILIINPHFCTITKNAYASLQSKEIVNGNYNNSFDCFLNFPQYLPYMRILRQFTEIITMCGSGSSCFVFLDHIKDKTALYQTLTRHKINFIESSLL